MSQYKKLDDAILLVLLVRGPQKLLFLNSGDVHAESERLAQETGREAFRILDGRLQALRRAQKIKFTSKDGWYLWKE